MGAEGYVEELERQGQAWQYLDAFAFHPYADKPEAVLGRLNAIRATLSRDPHLAAKPVWITEVGFHAEQKGFPYPGRTPNEQVKATYLTQTYTTLRDAGIAAPIFWYDLSEHSTFSSGSRAGYGLQHVDSVSPLRKTNLPAYDAMRRLP